jgi:citrate lyase subunit beta / citryl-CoA lyase
VTSRSRWLRSLLFVPGQKLAWMLKASGYGADALIFDLEDAVPVGQKEAARRSVAEALSAIPKDDAYIFVRVNGWDTGQLLEDVLAVVGERVDGIMLAKVRGAVDVAGLDLVLSDLESSRGLEPGSIELVPLAETAAASEHFFDICQASPRIVRVPGVSGLTPNAAGDLHRALGVRPTDDGSEMLYTSSRSVVAARAAGIDQILGGMTVDLSDFELLERSLRRARDLGATGSMAIHPTHIPIINRVFTPSAEEIDEAVGILQAMASAVANGDAAARHAGKMVDYAHAKSSYVLLDRAMQCHATVPSFPEPAELHLDR